ncbi:MAG: hypothetical protein PVF04_08085, partial [Anaerolineae bacterium]
PEAADAWHTRQAPASGLLGSCIPRSPWRRTMVHAGAGPIQVGLIDFVLLGHTVLSGRNGEMR